MDAGAAVEQSKVVTRRSLWPAPQIANFACTPNEVNLSIRNFGGDRAA